MRRKKINILFTCAGRRVSLVRAFARAASRLKLRCTTVGVDRNPLSPALYVCDRAVVCKPVISREYISQLLSVVEKNKIDLVVPTIDTELIHLARHRAEFEERGATVLISAPEVINICQDKRRTYRFLQENGFQSPWTRESQGLKVSNLKFPVFLKPWDGSASRCSTVVRDAEEFKYISRRIPNCIVQEYTCDVYVDFSNRVRCVVPRKRIEVRAGEVSKSQTARLPEMMDTCRRLVEKLGAGPGLITIQCFLTPAQGIKFIEINPRFGGGAPLSIAAGADFPRWILSELSGSRPKICFDDWQDSYYMLRYDEAVWVNASDIVKY